MKIRFAEEADTPAIRAIYAPIVENTVISFEDEPPDVEEMADRIADTGPEYPWLVCERERTDGEANGIDGEDADPEIAGYAYAGRHRKRDAYRWSVDVSVYVAEAHRRRGVGRGLYESLFALLRRQGFYNAYAGIALPNEASVALHEALGFEQVGVYESVGYKRGAWRDVGWWQSRLRDRPDDEDDSDGEDDPGQPRTLDELDEPERVEALETGEGTIQS